MESNALLVVLVCLVFLPLASTSGGPKSGDSGDSAGDGQDQLRAAVGSWQGTCKTWFTPGKLADESNISGAFNPLQGGRYVRFTYSSTLKSKPYTGEYTLIYNQVEDIFQAAWFDSFHMNYGLMFSVGRKTAGGFSVKGQYRMSRDQAFWGWRTEFEWTAPDRLTITAYNITPDGLEAKAVETILTRKK